MNASTLAHAGYSLLMMAAVWLLTGNALAGGLLGIGFFAGREHAQAEYRAIASFYDGKRENMPDWAGFMPRSWDLGSVMDLAAPIVSVLVALVISKFV
jgi:hypothetical protein